MYPVYDFMIIIIIIIIIYTPTVEFKIWKNPCYISHWPRNGKCRAPIDSVNQNSLTVHLVS